MQALSLDVSSNVGSNVSSNWFTLITGIFKFSKQALSFETLSAVKF